MTANGECSFLGSEVDGKRETLVEMRFRTRYGEVIVPAGFATNLFSVVPDTNYPDFWKASIVHDYLYVRLKAKDKDLPIKNKRQADQVFYDEMLVQSAIIFGKLQENIGTEFAVEEFQKLLVRSRVYYYGVSGWLGRIYQLFM